MLFLIVTVLFFASSCSAGDIKEVDKMCDNNQTCFSFPENCELKNCELVLSIKEESTEVFAKEYKDFSLFILYTNINGQVQDEIFVCFPSVAKCFFGIDPQNERYKVEKLQMGNLEYEDVKNGDFLLSFTRAVVQTGKDVHYSFKKGAAGSDLSDSPMTPLFHVSGQQIEKNHKRADRKGEVRTVAELFAAHPKSIGFSGVEKEKTRKSRKSATKLKDLGDLLDEVAE